MSESLYPNDIIIPTYILHVKSVLKNLPELRRFLVFGIFCKVIINKEDERFTNWKKVQILKRHVSYYIRYSNLALPYQIEKEYNARRTYSIALREYLNPASPLSLVNLAQIYTNS